MICPLSFVCKKKQTESSGRIGSFCSVVYSKTCGSRSYSMNRESWPVCYIPVYTLGLIFQSCLIKTRENSCPEYGVFYIQFCIFGHEVATYSIRTYKTVVNNSNKLGKTFQYFLITYKQDFLVNIVKPFSAPAFKERY